MVVASLLRLIVTTLRTFLGATDPQYLGGRASRARQGDHCFLILYTAAVFFIIHTRAAVGFLYHTPNTPLPREGSEKDNPRFYFRVCGRWVCVIFVAVPERHMPSHQVK